MITDEKIKEEFEKFDGTPSNHWFTETGCAYLAGFRTAERLAKIEVLEEIVSQFSYMLIDDTEDDYQCGRLSVAEDILETIKEKIEKLKSEP